MQTTNKTYVHISKQDSKGETDHLAWPSNKKELQNGEDGIEKHSVLTYPESEFDSVQEFNDSRILENVKRAVINRGWTLLQQQTARQLVLADDTDYVTKDFSQLSLAEKDRAAIDIFDKVNVESEGRKASPESKIRTNIARLADMDPAKALDILREFQEQIEAAQRAAAAR